MRTIRLATRKSPLALWQANDVADPLQAAHPQIDVEIIGMTTEGDRNKVSPLSQIGGKGVFVKELEVALLENRADIAVHSMKDVPSILPDPPEAVVLAAAEAAKEADADAVIGFGGGSSLDVAKLAAVLATVEGLSTSRL